MSQQESTVQSVNSRRPQITNHHSYSAFSSAGYLSDYASDVSSEKSAHGYETPPSRISSPTPRRMQHAQMNQQEGATGIPAPLNVRQPGQAQALSGQYAPEHDLLSPPTPGVDDTPYVRFALEQLTFDEELMGSRDSGEYVIAPQVQPAPIQRQQVEELRPQRQLVLPYSPPPQEPRQLQQPFEQRLPPSLEQRQQYPPPVLSAQPLYKPPYQSPPRTTTYPTLPQTAPSTLQETPRPQIRAADVMLRSAEPPRDRHQLGYVPLPLRPISLLALICICLIFVILLIASNVYALTNHGLYDYDGNDTARYFLFQYLPSLLGLIPIFWLFSIQAAIYRILPYTILSGDKARSRGTVLATTPIIPANFVLPDWRFFKLGEPLIGITLCVFWLSYWTIPLLGCLYNTQWFTNGTPRFIWTPLQGLAWFIMIIYLSLMAALIYLLIRFRRRNSALMWDPTSLADLIILFQRSNMLADYSQSETMKDLAADLPPRYARLGYWTTNQSPDYFYAVGETNQPYVDLPSTPDRFANEKNFTPGTRMSNNSETQLRTSQASSFVRMLHSPYVRYRWAPWFLRDGTILAWTIAAILLLIAFLVISFVNHAVNRGFFALLPATTRSDGFSPANFLYSFLAGVLGMFLFLAWQPIDMYFRSVQPYANLSSPTGATARRSILLSYNSMLPVEVTTKALINGDLRVAYISFISLLSAFIPVLAGGVFTALLYTGVSEVRMTASMPGYIALCVFLVVYALSYLTIWPTRFRYLPHNIDTVAGNLSFLYASRLLKDSSIRNIRTKADFIARLDGKVNTGLTRRQQPSDEKARDSQIRYGFGIYTGIDGKEHLGIDRMQRPGSGETMLISGDGHSGGMGLGQSVNQRGP